MANEGQTPVAPDTETATRPAVLTDTVDGFTAKYSGGKNSPNLPVGNWEFKLNDEGTGLFIETKQSAKGNDYDVAYVTPKGQPDGQQRTVYTSAFIAPTAKGILYDTKGNLKSSATFGVFSSEKDGVRTTTVSTDATKVSAGIAAANAAYSKQRSEREKAEAAG